MLIRKCRNARREAKKILRLAAIWEIVDYF
jgi:hypothetical protein